MVARFRTKGYAILLPGSVPIFSTVALLKLLILALTLAAREG